MLGSGHEFEVPFDRDILRLSPEFLDQLGDSDAVGNRLRISIERDIQGRALKSGRLLKRSDVADLTSRNLRASRCLAFRSIM